jgi:hypothetical protein
MKELINEGKIELIGDWKNGWKDIVLKLPAAVSEEEKPELDITV